MRIVLASSSPRRRDLLGMIGLEFEVAVPGVDETRLPDESPAEYVERVARAKAAAVSAPGAVVVAADTTVVHRGQVLGKPSHPSEARSMLARLSGETHTVLTGVAVCHGEGEQPSTVSEVASSVVRFLPLTEEEIAVYVASGEPMDKAGAYALQGLGSVFVESVQGSPSNVVGLPVHVVARLLRSVGIDVLARN